MEPIYQRMDYCSEPKTLWGKLQSGEWDWLGIDRDRNFILGYPRRVGGVTDSLMVVMEKGPDVIPGDHTVRIYDDPGKNVRSGPVFSLTSQPQ